MIHILFGHYIFSLHFRPQIGDLCYLDYQTKVLQRVYGKVKYKEIDAIWWNMYKKTRNKKLSLREKHNQTREILQVFIHILTIGQAESVS